MAVLAHGSARNQVGRHVDHTATLDPTVTGSRCGQAALLRWYVIRRYGVDGLRSRVDSARDLAAYATARLTETGWSAWRHGHAFTVVFPTPPREVTERWALASSGGGVTSSACRASYAPRSTRSSTTWAPPVARGRVGPITTEAARSTVSTVTWRPNRWMRRVFVTA